MYYQGSLVLVPDGGNLIATYPWIVSYWLYEVVLVSIADCWTFLAADIEITFADICVGFVAGPLYALEARGFRKLDISVAVEE
jgi:hypothetical protein